MNWDPLRKSHHTTLPLLRLTAASARQLAITAPARSALAFLLLSIILALPIRARAETEKLPRWGVEIKSGPYRPHASANAVEREYFELMYFSGEDDSLFTGRPLLTAIEVSWYLSQKFGLLGLNFGVGHWRASGRARVCGTADDVQACTPETVFQSHPGNTPIGFSITPLTLGAVYRMDLLKRTTWVPLVPYAKAGVDAYIWQATAAGSIAEGAGGQKGRGWSYGLHGALGLALSLSFLEPDMARRAAATTGISDTFLFIEARQLWGTSFEDRNRFDTTDRWYNIGLAMDFL